MLFHTAGGSCKREIPTTNHLFPAVASEYGRDVLGIVACLHEVTFRCNKLHSSDRSRKSSRPRQTMTRVEQGAYVQCLATVAHNQAIETGLMDFWCDGFIAPDL